MEPAGFLMGRKEGSPSRCVVILDEIPADKVAGSWLREGFTVQRLDAELLEALPVCGCGCDCGPWTAHVRGARSHQLIRTFSGYDRGRVEHDAATFAVDPVAFVWGEPARANGQLLVHDWTVREK